MISCGGVDPEVNKKAAEIVCNCMDEKAKEKNSDISDLDELAVDLDYVICSLKGAYEGADIESDDFTQALKEACPELEEVQKRSLESN